MSSDTIPENPYVLLTPGPLSTTPTVKAAMLRDWCTWDDDDNGIVQDVRRQDPHHRKRGVRTADGAHRRASAHPPHAPAI